jgi:hypothetical protein
MKIFRIAFFIIVGVVVSACTTSRVSSFKDDKNKETYANMMVLYNGSSTLMGSTVAEVTVRALKNIGVRAMPAHELLFQMMGLSAAQVYALVGSRGVDSILMIMGESDVETVHNFHGYDSMLIRDVAGNLYRYQTPRSSSYVSTQRGFKAVLMSVKTQQAVWIADVEVSTVSPAQLRLMKDFREDAVNKLAVDVVNKLLSDGLVSGGNNKKAAPKAPLLINLLEPN